MFALKPIKIATMLAAALVLLSACASPKKANIDYDKNVNFSQYQTFAFYQATTDSAEPTADAADAAKKPAYDPLVDQHFKTAIRREMTALGYRYDEQAPQLLVNYTTNVENREDVRSSPFSINAGYGFFGRNSALSLGFPLFGGVETNRYKVGSVLIDVIDASANRLIWQGMVEGKLTSAALKNPEKSINETVTLIYQSYPTRLANKAG